MSRTILSYEGMSNLNDGNAGADPEKKLTVDNLDF